MTARGTAGSRERWAYLATMFLGKFLATLGPVVAFGRTGRRALLALGHPMQGAYDSLGPAMRLHSQEQQRANGHLQWHCLRVNDGRTGVLPMAHGLLKPPLVT